MPHLLSVGASAGCWLLIQCSQTHVCRWLPGSGTTKSVWDLRCHLGTLGRPMGTVPGSAALPWLSTGWAHPISDCFLIITRPPKPFQMEGELAATWCVCSQQEIRPGGHRLGPFPLIPVCLRACFQKQSPVCIWAVAASERFGVWMGWPGGVKHQPGCRVVPVLC